MCFVPGTILGTGNPCELNRRGLPAEETGGYTYVFYVVMDVPSLPILTLLKLDRVGLLRSWKDKVLKQR